MWWKLSLPMKRTKKRGGAATRLVRRQLAKGDKNKIRGIYNRAAY